MIDNSIYREDIKYEAGIYMEFNNSEWKKLSIQDAYTLGSSFEDTFNAYFGK